MKQSILLFSLIFLVNCSQQKARKPISHSEGSFMKESAERNKILVANEEKIIDSIIKSNPTKQYITSKKGYWYTYELKNTTDTLKPKRGDIAYFDYEVRNTKGNLIYSKEELKPQIYTVDKQNIMMGLRDGIKLMHKGEVVTFLFTSNNAYGYHGDNNKISTNELLICNVTLNDFKVSNQLKKVTDKKTESKSNKKDSVLVKSDNEPINKIINTKEKEK